MWNVFQILFSIWLEMSPPKVRKSKTKDDSNLHRLSIRNLLWYCYLDQDEIDSNFFHLGINANQWKRLSSRDVFKGVLLVFHQEKVSELEESLFVLREKRKVLRVAANALIEVLDDSSIDSYDELNNEIKSLSHEHRELVEKVKTLKSNIKKADNQHAVDKLRNHARKIFHEIDSLENCN